MDWKRLIQFALSGSGDLLGSQSVVVDVRIPAAITFINGGGPSVGTLEETVDRKQWGQTERSPISMNGNQ